MKIRIPFLILSCLSTAICIVNSSLAIYLCKIISFEPTLVALAVGELIPLVGIIVVGTSQGGVLFMGCLVVSCVTSLASGIAWLARIVKNVERMGKYLESSYSFTICLISMFILSQVIKIVLTHFIPHATPKIEFPKDEESFAMETILNYKASAQTLVQETNIPIHHLNEGKDPWCNDNNDSVKIHKSAQQSQDIKSNMQLGSDGSSQQGFDPEEYKVHNHKESLKSKRSLEFEKNIIRNISNSLLPPVLQQGKSDISYLRNEMMGTLKQPLQNNENQDSEGKLFIDDLSDIPETYPQKDLWNSNRTGNISHVSLRNWNENYNDWNQRQERKGVTTELYQLNPEFRNTEQLFHNNESSSVEHMEQETSFGAPSLYSFSNNKLRQVESQDSSTGYAKVELALMTDVGSKQTLIQEEEELDIESKGKRRRSSIATFKNTSPIKKLRELKNEIRSKNSVHHRSNSSLTSSVYVGVNFASAPTSPVKRKTHSLSKSISCFHVSSQSIHKGDRSLRAVQGSPEKPNLSTLRHHPPLSDNLSSRESSQGSSCPSMFVGQYDREKWTKLKSKEEVIV
ncbi:BA75_01566T0 [Komagataella pastoris]|uniref:BA75_01566T0 n=1 Tax=Komagataella pastoris TaxID=4922 RepID=A0A1B2J5D1_PICPA|nr:BA75_01566T0 [Komagataella pastoris]